MCGRINSTTTSFFLFFLLWLNCSKNYSQQKDTLKVEDSLLIYKKIKNIAQKNKLLLELYKAVFKDPEPKEYPAQPVVNEENKMVNPYLNYTGAVIRDVLVDVRDPFGYNLTDTVQKMNFLWRIANAAHVTTRHRIIKNMLLFKNNDQIDPLKISESERILRTAAYITDARISIKPVNADTVDVYVTVLDRWMLDVVITLKPSYSTIKLRDRNILGQGHLFEQSYSYTHPVNLNIFEGAYSVANLGHSFISSNAFYSTSINATKAGLSFDRPFFSPVAKWAGGVAGSKTWAFFGYTDASSSTERKTPLDYYNYDIWAAKSFKFNRGKTILDQSTNLTLGWRYYGTAYENRPTHTQDPYGFFNNNSFVLGSIGFSVQQFYKDRYIYRFGLNEDITEGFLVNWVYGFMTTEKNKTRVYSGINIGRAKHFRKIGYCSAFLSYGILYNARLLNNTTFVTNLYYFSNLQKTGRWYFRQFVNYKYTEGSNKPFYETVALRSDELFGFNSGTLDGTKKSTLTFESVAYAPYRIFGFRFGTIIMAGVGVIGNNALPLVKSPIYQAYSAGLLVRNENLIGGTFEVTLGYYPYLPNGRTDVFLLNPVLNFNVKIQSFSTAKPSLVPFE